MLTDYAGCIRPGRYSYSECPFATWQPNPALQPTVRLPRWSNSNQSYLGRPLGDGAHNMRLALDDSLMPAASNWVNNPPPPPAPGLPTSNPAACNGQTVVIWPAVSGSTYYRLSRSAASSFSNPIVAYSGPNTSTLINLGTSGITYLRAQACNAGGCSAYSPQAVGSGYSGCP